MDRIDYSQFLKSGLLAVIFLSLISTTSVGAAPIQIQVGAFSHQSNANVRKQRLEEMGFSVRIQQNAQGLNRVRIVKLSDSEAKTALRRLKAKNLPHFTLEEPAPEEQFDDRTKQVIEELPELRFGLQTRLSEAIRDRMDRAMGTPYVWGGESFKEGGFDCSGLLVWLLRYDDMPRVSYLQWKWTQPISQSNMRPGDFIFFNFESTDRPDHVGLYLGDNRFVHASSTYGVIKANFQKAYYQKSLWGIGRPPSR